MTHKIRILFLLIAVVHGADGNCDSNPVGVSDQATIPDNQITASSQYGNGYQAAYGRLNGDRGDGWCAQEAARDDDWLQVDLGRTYDVCGVATQGDRNGNEYVTDFKLSFSSDGNTWTFYKDGNVQDQVFHRNGNSNTIDQHTLPTSVAAKYIRFHPTARVAWNCLRVEVYGAPNNCDSNPVGVSDQATIADNQITASSQYGNGYQAAYGRLNGDRGDGWCAQEAARDDDWLQVDLGGIYDVCGVATHGDRNGNEYVTDFKLSFSSDGNNWTFYQDGNGQDQVFHRNGNSNTIDQHTLPTSVSARYIRFHPTARVAWNCLRVEVYGIPGDGC